MHQETGRGILKLQPHPNRVILSLISTKLIYLILLLVEVNYMIDKPTLDTNILIYAFGKNDDPRKQVAKEIITICNIISLQVVNETVYVQQKKF